MLDSFEASSMKSVSSLMNGAHIHNDLLLLCHMFLGVLFFFHVRVGVVVVKRLLSIDRRSEWRESISFK